MHSTIRLHVGVECATISSDSRMISVYIGTDNDVSTAGHNRMVTISSGVDGVTSVGVMADVVGIRDKRKRRSIVFIVATVMISGGSNMVAASDRIGVDS